MSKTIPSQLAGGGALYVSEQKIYPREVHGRFDRLRTAAVIWLLGMYYLMPWINWGGRQSVLFDLPARRFYVLGLEFWPQDFIFLAALLILAGLSLFFFTAVAGRLWCGYACPQTVWTEVFLWMERWAEGDRNQRMKLDAAPWTAAKFRKKLTKHSLWLVFALWTGFTFVGFFTPIRDLGARLFELQWGGWEIFWVLFYSLATWGNAGFLREQVCKYMCPYARFQGAMFDRDTLIISYDPRRGEPRGSRKKGLGSVLERARGLLSQSQAAAAQWVAAQRSVSGDSRGQAAATTALVVDAPGSSGSLLDEAPEVNHPDDLGDCIDCTICVQVCPTGIDIRNGLQYECIACGACIDACDSVMDKVGYPRGLIRYTTQNAVDGKRSRVLRPRVLIYGALLVAILLAWTVGVSQRSPLILDVLRDRNALYRTAADGSIENGYTLKLSNKLNEPLSVTIALENAGSIRLDPGQASARIPAADTLNLPITLTAASGSVSGRTSLSIVVTSQNGEALRISHDAAFFGPMQP